jgi:hypothetical protein
LDKQLRGWEYTYNCIRPHYSLGNIIVLAQAHRDPLNRIKKLRKLECFSEKRFKGLKDIIRGFTLTLPRIKFGAASFYQDRIEQRVKSRDEISYTGKGNDFSHIVERKVWWESESWDLVIDPENPWVDLSVDGEYLLKVLLKGRL